MSEEQGKTKRERQYLERHAENALGKLGCTVLRQITSTEPDV
jgi:hypothetical protein